MIWCIVVQPLPIATDEYVVFVSSGDDAVELRKLVKRLVDDALSPVLHQAGSEVRLRADLWEYTAANRSDAESVNAQFVERAKNASVLLCLLIQRLGSGTREELESAFNVPNMEIKLIWFVDRDARWPRTNLGTFLKDHKDRQKLFIDRAGSHDGDGAVVAIVRALFDIAAKALVRTPEEPFREVRDRLTEETML